MDATRQRRTRDLVRQRWYARHRSQRLARFLHFAPYVPIERKKPTVTPNVVGGIPYTEAVLLLL